MIHTATASAFGRRVPSIPQGGDSTLLIIEDHELLAEYMAILADDLGWRTDTAGSVQAAKQILQRFHPEVMALDLGLPDGDGVELLRYLARANFTGAILIVSSCDDSVLETCSRLAEELGLRVVGRARKPVTSTTFAELLRQTTGRRN